MLVDARRKRCAFVCCKCLIVRGRCRRFGQEKVWKRHPDQLDLTQEQLGEEITKFLTANNPNAPKNIVRFNFKEKAFKSIPTIQQEAVHLHIEGYASSLVSPPIDCPSKDRDRERERLCG